LTRGFTTIELLIVFCILSILLAISIPRAEKLLDRIRVRGAADEIETAFGIARHIAIARAAQATVDIDGSAGTLYVSVADDTVRRIDIATPHGVELASNRASMSYGPTGIGYGAANLSVVVQRNGFADTVLVSRLGRVRH
jgi:Tfp pilus assembly protein FimT